MEEDAYEVDKKGNVIWLRRGGDLSGAPEVVNGSFFCSEMELESLEGGPSIVKHNYRCQGNQLSDLEGAAETLNELVEEETPIRDILAKGYDEDTVMRVWGLLDRAEYKRRQAPPGVKITLRAFGRDRRYPITNGFLWAWDRQRKAAE